MFKFLLGRKKRSKDSPKAVDVKGHGSGNLQAKTENLVKLAIEEVGDENQIYSPATFGSLSKGSDFDVEVIGESLMRTVPDPEADYEGNDKHENIMYLKRDLFDFKHQGWVADNISAFHRRVEKNPELSSYLVDNKSDRDQGTSTPSLDQNGQQSDPGMGRTTRFWGSPMLKRSCSNIETRSVWKVSSAKSKSYDDLHNLSGNTEDGIGSSPELETSSHNADKVIFKRRSSCQVLPSRSKKLQWELFLLGYRNLHKPQMNPRLLVSGDSIPNPKGGYSSDTFEQIYSVDKKSKKVIEDRGSTLEPGSPTDEWPQDQWIAFSAESSSLDRVSTWVNNLELIPPLLNADNEDNQNVEGTDGIVFPSSTNIGPFSVKNHSNASQRVVEATLQANKIIQSLNSFSSVAHISGMGLKVIPTISAFSSLRAVNLSGNFIAHITPGVLPKSLHTLDLSRNKITTIGLRDLTKLRVLNLSYNRMSRIGHGLSNCPLIKELNLAGNKISEVEGLHRLLKLTLLDLSFNKITTPKTLGQLVANYKSLLALNLLGNPIQKTIGDDQLRKSVMGLVPQLAYLNKQPIKSLRRGEIAADNIAKANGSGMWSSRKRSTKRVSQVSVPSNMGRGHGGHRGLEIGQKSGRQRSKNLLQPSTASRRELV